MKHTIRRIAFVLALTLCCSLLLSGCIFECKHEEREIVKAVAPTCTETGLSAGEKCAKCDEILVAQVEVPVKHHYVDRICTECGKKLTAESQGLEFELNDDNTYTVVGIGTCKDKELVIPRKYRDVEVTAVDAYAINDTEITTLVIPDTVTDLGNYAFSSNEALTDVIIEASGKLPFCTFYDCTALANVTITGEITEIGKSAFASCSSLASINIPDSVESILERAFVDCTSLREAEVGTGVTLIEADAFRSCTGLKSVVFKNPKGWTQVSSLDSSETKEVDMTDPQEAAGCFRGGYGINDYIRK